MSRVAGWRFVLVLTAMFAIPATAQAEGGLLGAIMNFLSGGGRPTQEQAPPPPQPQPVPSAASPLDHFGLNNQQLAPSRGGPQVAYCVRTCDGRYFPLPKGAGNMSAMPAKICGAMCPTAETKIYSGNNIENAVAADGSRYSGLKNAFVYRERLIEGCSCNGGDGAGNTAINITADPTLRSGDIVVTSQGPLMFKVNKSGTRQSGEFAPVADNVRLSAKLRDKVTAIKVAKPGVAPLASPQDFARVPRPAPATAAVPAEPASPAATAAQIFDFKDFDAAELRGSMAMGYNGRQ